MFAGRYPVLIDGEAADYDFAARFTLLPDAAKTVQAMSAAPLRIKALDVYTGAPAPDVLIRQPAARRRRACVFSRQYRCRGARGDWR